MMSSPATLAIKKPLSLFSLPSAVRISTCLQCRHLHRINAPPIRIPKPTPFVPDVQTFLTLIGRGMSQHTAKIPSWEALFSLSSQQLKESGLEPARARRYLLWWRERFRNGLFGIGGDLKQVKDGVAELRIVEIPSTRPIDRVATLTKDAGTRRVIINPEPTVAMQTPAEAESTDEEVSSALPVVRTQINSSEATPIAGIKIVHTNVIAGTGVEPVKGHQSVVRLKAREGLWEERRGHKVDGGERRKAEVRAKRRAAERKNAR